MHWSTPLNQGLELPNDKYMHTPPASHKIFFFCIYLCPFFLQCRKRCQDAFCTGLPHTEISPAPRPLTESTFAFIYYFNITFYFFPFCVSQHLATSRWLWSPGPVWHRGGGIPGMLHQPPLTCGQASGSHSHLFPSFFWEQSWVKPSFPISQQHFVMAGLFSPFHLCEPTGLIRNEWVGERKEESKYLTGPWWGKCWGCQLSRLHAKLWRLCLSHPSWPLHPRLQDELDWGEHILPFCARPNIPLCKEEVGANPSCSSEQFPSQCIGIFPPPKAFHKSFPAHSLLWPLKVMSATQSCFSSWSHRSWVQLSWFQWHLICMDECFHVCRYM